jgi:hypothetical protein
MVHPLLNRTIATSVDKPPLPREENRPNFNTGSARPSNRPVPEARTELPPSVYKIPVRSHVTNNHRNMDVSGTAQPVAPLNEVSSRQNGFFTSSRTANNKRGAPATTTTNHPAKKPRPTLQAESQRPQTRSIITNGVPVASVPKPTPTMPTRMPRQSTKSMAAWHKQINDLYIQHFQGRPINKEGEHNFVNQFLALIENKEEKEEVILVLQQMYHSTVVRKKVRIECRWEQVLAGLVHAKLVDKNISA